MSDYYKQNFRTLNVDAHEIIGNAVDLQAAWAKENNVNVIGKELIIRQLKSISPEVVFFQDSSIYNGSWIEYVRSKVPSIKKIIGFRCSPYSKGNAFLFKNFDFMIACSGEIAEELRCCGIKTYEINHAFETSLVPLIENDNPWSEHDLTFIGSLFEGAGFHSKRKELLEYLVAQGIDIKYYGNFPEQKNLLLRQIAYSFNFALRKTKLNGIIGSFDVLRKIDNLTSMPKYFRISEKIIKNSHPPVFGIEMYKLLNKSKISLNIHGDIALRDAANLRLFEVTGSGSCLLTDWKENIEKFFKPDEEIVCFKTPEECAEKIKWLIENPGKCKEIAVKGQKRTLHDHSYHQRALLLNEIILNELRDLKK
jgi:hypothetical protein